MTPISIESDPNFLCQFLNWNLTPISEKSQELVIFTTIQMMTQPLNLVKVDVVRLHRVFTIVELDNPFLDLILHALRVIFTCLAVGLSFLSTLWLAYFWFIQSKQSPGAEMGLGFAYIGIVYIQALATIFFFLGSNLYYSNRLFWICIVLFIILSVYLISYV